MCVAAIIAEESGPATIDENGGATVIIVEDGGATITIVEDGGATCISGICFSYFVSVFQLFVFTFYELTRLCWY